MIVKLLTEYHLDFLGLKGGCTGSSESTHVKMPHCWKSHVLAQIKVASTHTKHHSLKKHARLTSQTCDSKNTMHKNTRIKHKNP